MLRTILYSLILLMSFQIAHGQEIELKLNFFGYRFTQNEERLNWKELDKATESNKEANLLIKKAMKNRNWDIAGSVLAGALIGIPIGQSVGGADPNWTLAYIGAGIVIATIPLTFSTFNNVNKGVDLYNQSLNEANNTYKPELQIKGGVHGVGLVLRL